MITVEIRNYDPDKCVYYCNGHCSYENMKGIEEKLIVHQPVIRIRAVDFFINHFDNFWPNERTWSGKKLVEIRIDSKINRLCTEIGTECQIGLDSTSEPHHNCAYLPTNEKIRASAQIHWQNLHFHQHGEGASAHPNTMDLVWRWDCILISNSTYYNKNNQAV